MSNIGLYEEVQRCGSRKHYDLLNHVGLVKRVILNFKPRVPADQELYKLTQLGMWV